MQTAEDPLTGESFIKKRSNQVFANRENQIKYNNTKAYQKRKAMSSIGSILDRNRSILKRVLAGKREIVKSEDFLLGAGFNFGCSTHTIRRGNDDWICVYDYGLLPLKEGKFRIIQFS